MIFADALFVIIGTATEHMGIQTEEDFIALVKQAEQDLAANPRWYTTRLGLFAALGYAVIFLAIFVLVGLVGGTIGLAMLSTGAFLLLLKQKLIFVVLAAIWVLLKALWVKFEPPEGLHLKRTDYPELFAELDNLSRRLKALKIHDVLLTPELNAAVVQHPRLGVLGWQKNYLILGYELLLVLSPDEARSVLAHEMGHLSGNHSRFHAWIYRVRQTWNRTLSAFDDVESFGGKIMHSFFSWYAPQFQAYSFALARQNEYEADAIAAELTSPEVASRALVSVYTVAPYLEQDYWRNYYAKADTHAEPPFMPYHGLQHFLGRSSLSRDATLDRISQEMQTRTHYADTHPCLKERLEALAATPQLPEPPETSAAEAWFGRNHQQVTRYFDEQWLRSTGADWKSRFEYVSSANQGLQAFATRETNSLTDEELWQYAMWTDEFVDQATALPLFRAYQQRHPEDPDPAWFIGKTLLDQGDAAGMAELRKAAESPAWHEYARHRGFEYLQQHKLETEAQAWLDACDEKNDEFLAAQVERDSIRVKATLLKPEPVPGSLETLRRVLEAHPNVRKAWLAQKPARYRPESPIYVVAFKPRGLSILTHKKAQNSVSDAISETSALPGTVFTVAWAGKNKTFAKRIGDAGIQVV